jgi:hypothetical protein
MTREIRIWLLCGLLAAIGALQACSSSPAPKAPEAAGTEARALAKGVFSASVLTVRVLDQVNATWIDSVKVPTEAQLATMRQTTATLVKARDVLKATAPCIDSGGACVEQLREVLDQFDVLAALLASVGVQLPAEVGPVLDFVRGYARGDA